MEKNSKRFGNPMTNWLSDRVWSDVEEEAWERVSKALGPRVLNRVEDVLDALNVPAWNIIHVISPSVSITGRGSQPVIED